jgi:NAD(P)-dependent dehydrogenase (short-subunit alcohol dehydrogenase family)
VVVVISLAQSTHAVAHQLAREGAAVVLLADEETADEAGRLAGELPGRSAVFVDPDPQAVAEFVQELFER